MSWKKHCLICNISLSPDIRFKSIYDKEHLPHQKIDSNNKELEVEVVNAKKDGRPDGNCQSSKYCPPTSAEVSEKVLPVEETDVPISAQRDQVHRLEETPSHDVANLHVQHAQLIQEGTTNNERIQPQSLQATELDRAGMHYSHPVSSPGQHHKSIQQMMNENEQVSSPGYGRGQQSQQVTSTSHQQLVKEDQILPSPGHTVDQLQYAGNHQPAPPSYQQVLMPGEPAMSQSHHDSVSSYQMQQNYEAVQAFYRLSDQQIAKSVQQQISTSSHEPIATQQAQQSHSHSQPVAEASRQIIEMNQQMDLHQQQHMSAVDQQQIAEIHQHQGIAEPYTHASKQQITSMTLPQISTLSQRQITSQSPQEIVTSNEQLSSQIQKQGVVANPSQITIDQLQVAEISQPQIASLNQQQTAKLNTQQTSVESTQQQLIQSLATLPSHYRVKSVDAHPAVTQVPMMQPTVDAVSSIHQPQSSLEMTPSPTIQSTVSQAVSSVAALQQGLSTVSSQTLGFLAHNPALQQNFGHFSSVTNSITDTLMEVTPTSDSRNYTLPASVQSSRCQDISEAYNRFSNSPLYTTAQWNQTVPVSTSMAVGGVPSEFHPSDQSSAEKNEISSFTPSKSQETQKARPELSQPMSQASILHEIRPMETLPTTTSHKLSDRVTAETFPPEEVQQIVMEITEEANQREKMAGLGTSKRKEEKKVKIKIEKQKDEKEAITVSSLNESDEPALRALKDRLESALQLSLAGRVCHSTYVCEKCEQKLDEVELYYKVVADFRQSFFKTAQEHGIKDSDIAEGLNVNSIEKSPKKLLERFLEQGDISANWQMLITPNFLDAPNVQLQDKLKKPKQEEQPETPDSQKSKKDTQKSKKEEEPEHPKKRGRPRKSTMPRKIHAPQLPRLRLPHREAKAKNSLIISKRRGRKPLRVLRNRTLVPTEEKKKEEAYDADTDVENIEDNIIEDDASEDEWKPESEKKQDMSLTLPKIKKLESIVEKKEVKQEKKEEEDADKGDSPIENPKKQMYECVICQKQFSGVTVLRFHLNKKHKVHNVEEPYKCAKCNKTFATPSAVRVHVKSHTLEESRTCETCNKSYGSIAALRLHIRNKHPHLRRSLGKFPCNACGKRFSCIQSLQLHTRNQHEKEREVHTCGVCKRQFLDKERMTLHEAKCEKDMQNLCLTRDMQAERSFICTICNASYKNKSAFKQHSYTHKDQKPHQCHLCESKFLYKKSLTDHVAAVHRGERRMKAYRCEVCGHGYSHAGDLAKHMTLHSGKFCCPTCNKACAGSYKLKEHMRIHTGEKPYKCEICGAAFTQAAGLKSHTYTHKTNKRFLCTICGMQFAHRTTFRRHGMTHTGERPYSCSICNKGFQFDWVLKDHIKTHTGEKPHLCAICGKSFTQPQHLKTHYRIHTGEKPYRCTHCDVSYRHLSSYNQHKRNCPVTGGDKKDQRPKIRKLTTSLQQTLAPSVGQMSTPAADILAHLGRPTNYLQPEEAMNIVTGDQNHMRLPTHHALLGQSASAIQHLSRSPALTETTSASISSSIFQAGVQSQHMHQARQLIQLGSLPQDLTQIQPSTPSSVGIQPMDMTSASAISIDNQAQHEQTVQTFSNIMQSSYNQNYVH